MLAMALDEFFIMYHGFKDNFGLCTASTAQKKVLYQLVFLPPLYTIF